MADLGKLARAMCSLDLAESQWTQELPRLPVPDLWLTVSRYLGSLRSVLAPTHTLEELLEDGQQLGLKVGREERNSNWRQFEHTDQLVKMFMLNEGPELQRDLKEFANRCQNWATDYWLQDMYLSNPLPLPVNSNPFFLFPRQKFASSSEMLMFATRIIQFSVDFKFRIDQQALRQDFGSGHGRGKALCMETYKNFFHSYRMPHEDMDRLLPQSRRSNHIVVASCNQFYILRLGQDPLENPYSRDAGSQLNEASIFEQLLRIYRVSREHARRDSLPNKCTDGQRSAGQPAPKVGLFTTENRKRWAHLHKRLTHCGPQAGDESQPGAITANTESLRQIEDCLFVMCLDSLVSNGDGDGKSDCKNNCIGAQLLKRTNECADGSESEEHAANIILTGGGVHLFTANRWFDKFLQIIVGRNGICGINIEHSASEGITVLRFLEEFLQFLRTNPPWPPTPKSVAAAAALASDDAFAFAQLAQSSKEEADADADADADAEAGAAQGASSSITSASYIEPKSPSALLEESDKITPLRWHLDEELESALNLASGRIDQLIRNFSLKILTFAHFGRAFVKSQNLSPDAFIQLALQFTFFKLHGRLVSTYESASLRQFRLGRVDNIRANTCEAYQWIQAMMACKERACRESDPSPFKGAEAAFIRAITKQVEILRYTITGGGPDNHLLVLRELAKIRYGADELPALFLDPSYREFNNFRLSTSQLPNESGITVGYGAVVSDGYGCSYNPREHSIVFCISSFVDSPQTSSSEFARQLEQSLLEMQQLCVGQNKRLGSGTR